MVNKIANTVRGPGESELYGEQKQSRFGLNLDTILWFIVNSYSSSTHEYCLSIACLDFHFRSPASLISGVGDLQWLPHIWLLLLELFICAVTFRHVLTREDCNAFRFSSFWLVCLVRKSRNNESIWDEWKPKGGVRWTWKTMDKASEDYEGLSKYFYETPFGFCI